MSNVPVARRYARALLDAAGPDADTVLQQLENITSYFDAQPAFFTTISSPALSLSQRKTLVDAVINNAPGIHPMVANLLKLLTDRNRFGSLPFIARQFRDMVDSRMGRVRGSVTSAPSSATPKSPPSRSSSSRSRSAAWCSRRRSTRPSSAAWSRRSAATCTTARSGPSWQSSAAP